MIVMNSKDLLEKAMKKAREEASREKNRQKADVMRISVFTQVVIDELKKALNKSKKELTPFEQEIIKTIVDFRELGNERRKAQESNKIIDTLYKEHKMKAKYARNFRESGDIRKAYYGRIKSIIKKIKLEPMEKFHANVKKLPGLKDEPTIIICGPPNVGKSEFLTNVSGRRVKVKPYPFTTKHILVGHSKLGYQDYQWIDTPGLLDRPPEKRNEIEKRAVAALTHLSRRLVFLVDPSENCGYTIKEQLHLKKQLEKETKPEKMITIATHADIVTEKPQEADEFINATDKEQVQQTAEKVLKKLFK